jgi:Tol biopolymer transport system component
MKRLSPLFRNALACGALILAGCQSATTKTSTRDVPAAGSMQEDGPNLISGMRQLTFDGRRAGEGYFSADGRYMIFQSERQKDNPFYQMYLMDLESGHTRRVSPGYGQTTCGWIHPDGRHVLFSSTHADPNWKKTAAAEWEERKHPKNHYAWHFDPAYDIYQADRDGKNLKNLTHTSGYDAEASYSPDGRWIAFASNRAAYSGKMTAEEKKTFARDPSYMMDIYLMRADGGGVKRLTSEPGYDGGPFFSPDGKRIVYRHFAPDGRTAEVFTMALDGGDKKQLTHMGAMSWAPFYHPSGDYIIFTSNKLGFDNFELYLIDSEGRHEPVRASHIDGFDGLPVFTPDGRHLVWTHKNDKGEAQLYRADWNDALARQALDLPTARGWVDYLTRAEFAGRQTGGPKEAEYTKTLADAFRALGLQPAMADGSYLQTYEFTNGVKLAEGNRFDLNPGDAAAAEPLSLSQDWIPLSDSKTGAVAEAPLVFAGYGVVAPALDKQEAYDAYKGLDVKGKWVVVFSGLPQDISNDRRFFLHTYARLQHKAMMARQRGATGLIVIEDGDTKTPALKLHFEGRSEDVGIPVVRLSARTADRLFADPGAGASRKEWTRKLAAGEPATFTFQRARASGDIRLDFTKSTARNVLALLPATDLAASAAPKTGTVIVGAHVDHLGHGEMGNSLSTHIGKIHPGADDNASGVAAVMEIARLLAEQARAGRLHTKQNILFALWTGEELGLFGSAHFANANRKYKLTASLNLDMVGRYRDRLFVQGVGSAPQWKSLIEEVQTAALDGTRTAELPVLQTQEDPYLPSDAMTFYMKQIPSIMFFTGAHPQYHTENDTPDLINFNGLNKIAGFGAALTAKLAAGERAPVTYQKVDADPSTHPTRGFRLYLGTIPDYTRELKNGVAITGTSKGSPAEAAGLKPGDVIVELGGMKVRNLYDYVYCLQALKANVKTPMRVLRAGEERTLEIVPVSKVQ